MTTSDVGASGVTATAGLDYSWLPDHQLHVVATVAHVHELVASMTEVVHEYVAPPGPLSLDTVAAGDLAQVVVTAVAPLPATVSRSTATALTELRAAVEHVLYAEVEQQIGRELSEKQGRSVEMPACANAYGFARWLSHRERQKLRPFQGGALVDRLRALQPFLGKEPGSHPLRLLAGYTNRTKHRAPAVPATRLGVVMPDVPAPGLFVRAAGDYSLPLQPGDVIASSPRNLQASLSIVPTVSLERPGTGSWPVLIDEIETIEVWVRTVAIPTLVAGTSEVAPLPPRLDITVGHDDPRAAMTTAGMRTAIEQFRTRLGVGVAREALIEILMLHPSHPSEDVVRPWAQTLTDNQVLDKQRSLPVSTDREDLPAVLAAADKLLAEAQQHSEGEPAS